VAVTGSMSLVLSQVSIDSLSYVIPDAETVVRDMDEKKEDD